MKLNTQFAAFKNITSDILIILAFKLKLTKVAKQDYWKIESKVNRNIPQFKLY